MTEGWIDPEDCLLALNVFGTDDPGIVRGMILSWTAKQGRDRACISAIELSIGAAVTVLLPGQTRIVVKVWSGTADARSLTAQIDVQAAMAAGGLPAPAVLTKLSALGPGWAVGMRWDRAGVPTDVRIPGVRRMMAAGLAHFVVQAKACRGIPGLPQRFPPPEGVTWPEPHSALFDFKATASGAEWIDEAARKALSAMRSAGSRTVVGHHDWNAKNMRMGPDGVAALYDWNAVFLDREAFVLGSAAAHFPVTWELDVPETPEVEEVAAFVRECEQARSTPFTCSELADVEVGATYARAYTARCEHAIDSGAARWHGSSRESLWDNGPFRFDQA